MQRLSTQRRNILESSSLFGGTTIISLAPPALALALAIVATGLVSSCEDWARWPLLGQGGGEDCCWQIEVFPKVLDAFICKEVVVPHPAEFLSDVSLGAHGLHHHHHVQVWNVLQ